MRLTTNSPPRNDANIERLTRLLREMPTPTGSSRLKRRSSPRVSCEKEAASFRFAAEHLQGLIANSTPPPYFP
jgi:hypothetical protein